MTRARQLTLRALRRLAALIAALIDRLEASVEQDAGEAAAKPSDPRDASEGATLEAMDRALAAGTNVVEVAGRVTTYPSSRDLMQARQRLASKLGTGE